MLDMEHTIRRNTVQAAVMQSMFCQESGRVLDIDDAYLVTLKGGKHDGKLSIICGKEWRRLLDLLPASMVSDTFKEVWEGKTGDEVFPSPQPELGSLKYFAVLLQEQTLARHKAQHIDCQGNSRNAIVTIKPGRVYVQIDQGGSGRFMVERETGIIYGIRGYGKVHKGREYGTLATVDLFQWGGYSPALKGETDKEALANQCTARRACDEAKRTQAALTNGGQ